MLIYSIYITFWLQMQALEDQYEQQVYVCMPNWAAMVNVMRLSNVNTYSESAHCSA